MANHPWGHIFPVQFQTAWTTYPHSDTATATQVPSPVFTHVPLDDAKLGVHRISKGTTHDVCTLADGTTRAWEAVYPQGSYKPTGEIKGGFGFYLAGPRDWRLAVSQECIFSYAVLFEEGFDFVKGGKLPGICRYPIGVKRVGASTLYSSWRRGGQIVCLHWRPEGRTLQLF